MDKLNEIKKALEILGLNANAVKFYLASYKEGAASVGQIARQTGIDRSSAYLAMEQLMRAGLMDDEVEGKRKRIFARPPQAILSRLRSKSRALRNQCMNIENTLPALLAEYSQKDQQPVLQFFSGKAGLKQITDDILESTTDELLVFSNQKEEKRVFNKVDHNEFVVERMRRRIRIRVICPDTVESRELQARDAKSLRETRIIKQKNIPFTNEIYIYADKIAMLEFVDEVQGFIVKSRAFSEAQKWLFEEIWDKCK